MSCNLFHFIVQLELCPADDQKFDDDRKKGIQTILESKYLQ